MSRIKKNIYIYPKKKYLEHIGFNFFRKFQGNGSKCGSIVPDIRAVSVYWSGFFLFVCMLKKNCLLVRLLLKKEKKSDHDDEI